MVVLNYSGEEINAKIVYYGPGLSGKTTNLEHIHEKMPAPNKGKLVSMKTRTDRTLFFDFLPLELGDINGYRTRFMLYTVPGQVYYNATRKLVLKGADAVVFVADSSRAQLQENIESLRNLEDNLNEHGLSLDHLPWVIQYNKRDVPDAMPVEELHQQLNVLNVPAFEAVATRGPGVYETFQGVATILYQELLARLTRESSAPRETGVDAPAPDDGVSDAVDTALREVGETTLMDSVPAATTHENETRAQSVVSPPVETPPGQAPASAPIHAPQPEPAAAQGAAPAPGDPAFGFESIPPRAPAAPVAPTPARATGESMDGFIMDPTRSSPPMPEPKFEPAQPVVESVAPEPPPVETAPAATVESPQVDVAVATAPEPPPVEVMVAPAPEPRPAAPEPSVPEAPPAHEAATPVAPAHGAERFQVSVPVDIPRSKLRPGTSIRLVLDVQVVDD